MKILASGDSFTYGEELSDCNLSYANLLSQRTGGVCVNIAQPSASNDKILRKTIEYLINPLSDSPDLVIIGWTNLGRSEWADETGTYDVWPGYGGNMFIKDGAIWRRELVDYISKYHDIVYFYKKFLQQVILLQDFLKARDINYVMINTIQNEYYKNKHFNEKTWYFDQIDQDRFLGFNQEGMAEWTFGLPQGPNGHFLEEGHQQVADKIYEHIRNLGWVS